jgi:hypothetical protein
MVSHDSGAVSYGLPIEKSKNYSLAEAALIGY